MQRTSVPAGASSRRPPARAMFPVISVLTTLPVVFLAVAALAAVSIGAVMRRAVRG